MKLEDDLRIQPLHPRVLIPILLIGGALACVQAAFGPHPTNWSRYVQASTALVTWSIAVWVVRRGVSREAMFVMVVWADTAITAGAASMGHHQSVTMVSLAMLALPSGVIALYGSARMLIVQAVAVVASAAIILSFTDLQPTQVVIQSISTLLATMSPSLAVSLLRGRLMHALELTHRASLTDPLTGLLNRRGLEMAAVPLVATAARLGLSVGVVILDLDHFKILNDRHGHSAGDQALRHVADCLTSLSRDGDVAARLGGEEFALLCVCQPDQVPVIGERVRTAIRQGADYGLTASIGATWFRPRSEAPVDLQHLWSVIDHADELQYQAKRDGRDRVAVQATSP